MKATIEIALIDLEEARRLDDLHGKRRGKATASRQLAEAESFLSRLNGRW